MTDNRSSAAVLDQPGAIDLHSPLPQLSSSASLPSAEPNWIRRGQIPGLDGLRAIAVLSVLATHTFQTRGFPDWPFAKYLAHQGVIGVDIFFVISGFLITTLLARELERDDQIQLKRFYVRRFLRIMPAYGALMFAVAICQAVGYFQLQPRDWIGALTYTSNFLYHPSWELGHSWSLSVEEHFYLIWPFVLFAGGVAAGWRVGLACLITCWGVRCAIAFGVAKRLFPADSIWSDVSWTSQMAENWTFTRLDTITMGSLFALACRSQSGRAWLDWLTRPKVVWVYAVVLCASIVFSRFAKFNLCIAYTLNALCIALLMWGLIQSRGIALRWISNPVLKVIGLGSYSIYLWQQLFIHPRHDGWAHMFPQNVFLALSAACLSYWLIERPINQLKDKVAA